MNLLAGKSHFFCIGTMAVVAAVVVMLPTFKQLQMPSIPRIKRRARALLTAVSLVFLLLNIAFVHKRILAGEATTNSRPLLDDEVVYELKLLGVQQRNLNSFDNSTTSTKKPLLQGKTDAQKIKPKRRRRVARRKKKKSIPLKTNLDLESFSACMLIKDDNDLLNEWLAYHYHVLDLRYLVVAVDPSSATSPAPIFDRWRRLTDLQITEWSDPDFMPKEFLRKGYYISPDKIEGDATKSQWHEGHEDAARVKADNMIVSNHRFRQVTFLAACLRHMRTNDKTWTMHVDTDEFVVVNPLLRNTTQENVQMVEVGPVQEPSSVFSVIKQFYRHDTLRSKFNYPCISMPRLLFGSIEFAHNNSSSSSNAPTAKSTDIAAATAFNSTLLETLRWRYHTDYDDKDRNAQPKVIVDVSAVDASDEMFKNPFSIHRPSYQLCRRVHELNFHQLQRYPFTVNHYTGSWERYFLAKNDTRRSERAYNAKAHVSAGYDPWMAPWLQGFVDQHGEALSKELLREYTATAAF